MDLDGMLERGRVMAEARMRSRGRVRRKGKPEKNAQRIEVDTWTIEHDDLPVRIGGSNAGSAGTRTVTIGTTEIQVAVRVASVPAGTTNLRDGDLLEIFQGENAGLVLYIVEATWQDQATARRLPVHEVPRPKEWAA